MNNEEGVVLSNQKVSIITGIYNCEATLEAAIASILAQSFTDWEWILCDDGSTDRTLEIARSYAKKHPDRIKVIRNKRNLGLNRTLNQCLKYASGAYIARMDGDDISLPDRLKAEWEFLQGHPEIAIVSCPMYYFDDHGIFAEGKVEAYPEALDFLRGTPICHAPCMVRKEAFDAVGGYSKDRRTLRAEDYDLWFRMYARGFRAANLPKPYYKMRDDLNAYHRRRFKYSLNEAYVKFNGFRRLHIPLKYYHWVLRPIIVGLLPKPVYMYLHQKKRFS